MSEWAAIVYARTYEVDFRFIVVPENFTADDQNWFLEHAHATIGLAEKIPGYPRWFLLSNSNYCIVGITSMASELLGSRMEELSNEVTRDSKSRPLYLCAGYVATANAQGQLPLPPPYSENSFQLFRHLYSYVRDQWFTKSYHSDSRTPKRSSYQELIYSPSQNFYISDSNFFELNSSASSITVWTDSETNRQSLWNIASSHILLGDRFVSLCLGLEASRNIVNCSFLNITTRGVAQKETIARSANISSTSTPPSKAEEKDEKENILLPSDEANRFYNKKAIGSLLGALLMSQVTGVFSTSRVFVVLGSLLGGSLGWIAGKWLISRGVEEKTAKQPYRRSKKSRTSASGNRRSLSNQEPDISEMPYGFRKKDTQDKSSSTEQDTEWF